MTPDQVKLCVQLAIAAVLLAAAAAGGWTVNGWRLGEELERVTGERDRAIDQGKALAASTEACTSSVKRVEELAGKALKDSRALLEEAKRLHAGGQAMAEEIERRLARSAGVRADGRPKGCDDAYDELETIRGP